MTDIFVTYAREDEDRVKEIVCALEQQGWSVFWDRKIPAGETWRGYIGKALDDASCVIVAWSRYSISSPWVAEEADDGKRRGVLIPVLLDSVEQPRGFREIQAANLMDWQPGRPSSRFTELCHDIRLRLHGAPRLSSVTPGSGNATRGIARQCSLQALPTRLSDPRILERPVNLGFDGPAVGNMPNGWFDGRDHVSNVSTRYDVRVLRRDDGVPGACVVMFRDSADQGEFGAIMQRVEARYLAGKALRYEADLRGEGLDGWAGLWLRIDGDRAPNLIFDNMHNRPVRGSTGWARFCLTVQLPEETVWLNYGIVLSGSGRLWADNCRVLVWSADGQWVDL